MIVLEGFGLVGCFFGHEVPAEVRGTSRIGVGCGLSTPQGPSFHPLDHW
jgi:hypothetical protein